MTELDKGMKARVRPVIVAGEISDRRFDPSTGEKELKLTWSAGGEVHERWFKPAELEPDPAAAAD